MLVTRDLLFIHYYSRYASVATTISHIIISCNIVTFIFLLLQYDQTLRYTIADKNHRTKLSLVTEDIELIPGTNYTVEIQIKNDGGNINVYINSAVIQDLDVVHTKTDNTYTSCFFAEEPSTNISLGGTADTMFTAGTFLGCINSLSIDGFQIPLAGIVKHNDAHLVIRGSSDNVVPFCHACMMAKCPTGTMCVLEEGLSSDQYTCQCPQGYIFSDEQCTRSYESSSPTPSLATFSAPYTPTMTSDIGNIESNDDAKLKLEFIIGIAAGGVILIFVILLLLGLTFRCTYKRKRRLRSTNTKANSLSGRHCNGISRSNDYAYPTISTTKVAPIPVSSPCILTNMKRSRRSSSSDADSIEGMPSLVCHTTSQETGFHTASEATSRRSTPRRQVSDSGKDSSINDSDYSQFETDSEDITTSGIEDAISPSDMKLVSSGSMISGYRKKAFKHLPPNDKATIPPLHIHPNSAILTSEDETDTEASTHIRRGYSDNDSIMSDPNSPKWYKNNSPADSDTSCTTPTETEPRKHSRHRRKPDSLTHMKQRKGSSSKIYNSHLSNSPLVSKSYRYDYPPPHNHYGEPIEPHNLPAIDEVATIPPYHHHMLYHQDPRMMQPHGHIPIYPPYPPPPHIPHPPPGPPPDMPYYSGYQGTSLTLGDSGIPQYRDQYHDRYRDLNSFSKLNDPISYWEQQTRLRPSVDQDEEALRFLTEPYQQFEDVSTTPSVVESSIMGDGESDYVIMASGIRRPPTSRGEYLTRPIQLNNGVGDSVESLPLSTRPDSKQSDKPHPFYELGSQPPNIVPTGGITHFPSADCSPTVLSPSDLESGAVHSEQ